MLSVKQALTAIADLGRRTPGSHSKILQVRHLQSGIPLSCKLHWGGSVSTELVFIPILKQSMKVRA